MAKQGWQAEHERQLQLEKEGFHCTRNSGSIGATDLIAVKRLLIQGFPFEVRYEQVKKTRNKTFYFNERSRDELRRLKEITLKFNIPCYFSIKFTNKGWKILNVENIEGKPIKYFDEKKDEELEKIKCNGCLKTFSGDVSDKIIGLCPKCCEAMDKYIIEKKDEKTNQDKQVM